MTPQQIRKWQQHPKRLAYYRRGSTGPQPLSVRQELFVLAWFAAECRFKRTAGRALGYSDKQTYRLFRHPAVKDAIARHRARLFGGTGSPHTGNR